MPEMQSEALPNFTELRCPICGSTRVWFESAGKGKGYPRCYNCGAYGRSSSLEELNARFLHKEKGNKQWQEAVQEKAVQEEECGEEGGQD